MASFNRIILVGHLGGDPEIRHLPSGDTIATISVATTETWKAKDTGEKKEATEWWKVTLFGRLAEVADEYLKKGSLVLIEGKGRTETWEKDGTKHYRFAVRADQMKMLGGRNDRADRESQAPVTKKTAATVDDDDDIPFISCSIDDDVIFRRLRWSTE